MCARSNLVEEGCGFGGELLMGEISISPERAPEATEAQNGDRANPLPRRGQSHSPAERVDDGQRR